MKIQRGKLFFVTISLKYQHNGMRHVKKVKQNTETQGTLTNKEKESNNKKRTENKKTYSRELIAKPPTTGHSCSRHGVVTAELTQERTALYLLQKHLFSCEYTHNFILCPPI